MAKRNHTLAKRHLLDDDRLIAVIHDILVPWCGLCLAGANTRFPDKHHSGGWICRRCGHINRAKGDAKK